MTGRLKRFGLAFSSSAVGGVVYDKLCRRIDRFLIPMSRGRLALGPPGQTVLITTTGARSGRQRQAALAFLWEGDDMVVIASKGGSPCHPGWYHNLKADPRVAILHRGGREERIAREAQGEERDRLFQRMTDAFETFGAYQERAAERRIPVMLLGPVTDPPQGADAP